MRLEYKNKLSDVFLYYCVHQFLIPVIQVFYLLIITLVFYVAVKMDSFGIISALIIATVVYLLLWAVQFIFNMFVITSHGHRALLTNHIVEMQDEAFYEETKYNKSYFYWNGIEKVVKRPGFVAVYTTEHNAHIIPTRAFSSREEMERFIFECKDRILKAKKASE